jgi:RsmE family RNA methyltransferase
VLQCASSLGIKKIILLNFFRVEKSLWQSSSLKEDAIHEQLILGLEQAKDTVLPEVILRKRFKDFADDELPGLIKGALPLVAHPGAVDACPCGIKQPVTLLIGPEGGLIDDELQKLKGLGFRAVDLGARILKVESVLPFVVGKLF